MKRCEVCGRKPRTCPGCGQPRGVVGVGFGLLNLGLIALIIREVVKGP